MDELQQVLACALRNHMVGEVFTTGTWVESQAGVREVLARLTGTICALQICTSRELLDRVGSDRIKLLILEAQRAHLGVSIRCGIGPNSPLPRELLALEPISSDASILQVVPLANLTKGPQCLGRSAGYLMEAPSLRRAFRFSRCSWW